MKNLILSVSTLLLCICASGQPTGSNAPKPIENNYHKSRIIVEIKDGTTVQGLLQGKIFPVLRSIEIKDEETKKKSRLTAEDMQTITVLPFRMKKASVPSDTTLFMPMKCVYTDPDGETEEELLWLRADYRGRNVSLYSFFYGEVKHSDMPGGKSAGYRVYYIQWPGEDHAEKLLTEGAGTIAAFGRRKEYAEKFSDYPQLVERVQNGEFNIRRGPYYVILALDEMLDNRD